MRPREYEALEGMVQKIASSGVSLWFREAGQPHDINVPLSQIEDGEHVTPGDTQINVSKWFLDKLEEEGKR